MKVQQKNGPLRKLLEYVCGMEFRMRGNQGAGNPELPLATLRISIADMVSLHVRTRGYENPSTPDILYQGLPTIAMSLMATIPRGLFAVSIPHQRDSLIGYSITRLQPSDIDGFTIKYARHQNGRYEAVDVLFQGSTYGIAEFHDIACRWVEKHAGRFKIIQDRFAYFVPDRRMWGVILRDSGYTALDPSKTPVDIISALQERDKSSIGGELVARIQVWCGNKQTSETLLPVFARVELTLDSNPGPGSSWIPFVEYQNARLLRSRLPASIIADFRDWLKLITAESGFEYWIFRPGMLFGDHIEWWGDRNRRRTEHEGLDFVEGVRPGAALCGIPEGTPVRAMADGEVVSVLDDFLNKTLVVRHPDATNGSGDVFYTFSSHIQPEAELTGCPVVKGQLLGRVAKSKDSSAPAHLHLTGVWIPQHMPPGEIRLDHIDPAFTPVVLVNFNEFVQCAMGKPTRPLTNQ